MLLIHQVRCGHRLLRISCKITSSVWSTCDLASNHWRLYFRQCFSLLSFLPSLPLLLFLISPLPLQIGSLAQTHFGVTAVKHQSINDADVIELHLKFNVIFFLNSISGCFNFTPKTRTYPLLAALSVYEAERGYRSTDQLDPFSCYDIDYTT